MILDERLFHRKLNRYTAAPVTRRRLAQNPEDLNFGKIQLPLQMSSSEATTIGDQLQSQVLRLLQLYPDGFSTDSQGSELRAISSDQSLLAGALKSLLGKKMVTYETTEREVAVLTEEGVHVARHGSHEVAFFSKIPNGSEGISVKELVASLDDYGRIGQNTALKNGWVEKRASSTGTDVFARKVATVADTIQPILVSISRNAHSTIDANLLRDLKKRKLVESKKELSFFVQRGACYAITVTKLATDLSMDMLISDQWKSLSFKDYNLCGEGIPPVCGALHPLLKVREEFMKIFLEMGFCEMPTNNFVESSFWNFDALFQPQQHPSREAHDTFFLKKPATSVAYPRDYMLAVKKMHEVGGFSSIGYRYNWKEEDAQKNILRTHTTAVSTRMLYALAQESLVKGFSPRKYFSIDRVYRNESMDATHLSEFHQIEGLVADYNLTLGDLIGMLDAFFQKLGCKRLRFKPAYNPYTEPSMEVFSYHEGLKRWIEVGNSGIFRPEMLLPMGLPPNVSVIAWGLSLERPTMIRCGLSNIRDLVGHRVDMRMIQSNPICRLDR